MNMFLGENAVTDVTLSWDMSTQQPKSATQHACDMN